MGNKILQLDRNKKTLTVDGVVHDFTLGLHVLIMSKHPRLNQWNSNDYQTYKLRCAQTKSFPNPHDHSQIHTLHGNISICLGKWLYLEKG